MKFLDLLRLITGNLSRRKARVALTAIGVVIGTAAVVILVSLAIGLQRNANEQLYGIGDLTQIQVMPMYGGEGGPVMVGPGGGPVKNQPTQQKLLTNFALTDLRAIPGVNLVIPRDFLMAGGTVKYQKLEGGVNIIGVDTTDLANLGLQATEGGTELERGEERLDHLAQHRRRLFGNNLLVLGKFLCGLRDREDRIFEEITAPVFRIGSHGKRTPVTSRRRHAAYRPRHNDRMRQTRHPILDDSHG